MTPLTIKSYAGDFEQLFWPEPIYWDINFVLKCLTAHCEAHRPPIENQCFHQVQWLTLQKPLPFHIGQNGCLPSFYVIYMSTHDDLVEMTRHGRRWIITNGSSDQWMATIENQCFHRVQWLTLQKPLPFHIGQDGCLPMGID